MQGQENTQNRFSYDGKTGELYKIFLLNIFLGIITLGIYHFWGKTRMRRYVCSSTSYAQDRFEYTGTGGELFWGAIKALVILLIISAPFFYAIYQLGELETKYPELSTHEYAQTAAEPKHVSTSSDQREDALAKLTDEEKKIYIRSNLIMVAYLIFYFTFIPFMAVFGSLRYRSSRTLYRGVHGHLKGSSIVYGCIGFMHIFLNLITLGLWIPFADLMLLKYKIKRLSFGSQIAQFKPQYGRLFVTHILTIITTVIATIPLAFIFGKIIEGLVTREIDSSHMDAGQAADLGKIAEGISMSMQNLISIFIYIYVAIFLFLIVGYLIRSWYRAKLNVIKYEGLTFGNIGFNCTITGWNLFTLNLSNALILILTLGLGLPFVMQRRMRYFCRHVTTKGNINQSAILQSTGKQDKWGEGLSSMFDVEIKLF